MPMIKQAISNNEYQRFAKDYVINMLGKKRKLHRKNGCHFSRHYSKYYDFDSIEEAEASGVAYTKCELCFPPK